MASLVSELESVSKKTRSPTVTMNSCWLPGAPAPALPTPVRPTLSEALREQAAMATTNSSMAAARIAVLMGAGMTTGRLLERLES
ncbi:hypothetical protein D3C87_1820660 [compost metagenome]